MRGSGTVLKKVTHPKPNCLVIRDSSVGIQLRLRCSGGRVYRKCARRRAHGSGGGGGLGAAAALEFLDSSRGGGEGEGKGEGDGLGGETRSSALH